MRKGEGTAALSPTLSRTPEDALNLLVKAQTAKETAAVLEVPWGQLKYLIYDQPEKERYATWWLPKRNGGSRRIDSPYSGISILQEKVVQILKTSYKPGPWVQAFGEGCSVVKNANRHRKRPWVLNIDLKDFYGSINFGRVRGLLMARPLNLSSAAASLIAQIVTYKNRLPQGAPSSPLISNMVAWALDRNLKDLAERHQALYTRYADDITFSSTKKKEPRELVTWSGPCPAMSRLFLGPELQTAISRSGFQVNQKKVRLQYSNTRQEVTGLTVNLVPNVRRIYVRKLRAMMNSWEKRGLIDAEEYHVSRYAKNPPLIRDGSYYRKVVYGHMAWLKSVCGPTQVYLRLCEKIAHLDDVPPKFIQEGIREFGMFDFFICHAGEDKSTIASPIADALESAGYRVFIDDKEIKWGGFFCSEDQ